MDPELDDGLRALDEAARAAESIRIEVDDQYVRWIAELEARPDNQSGADKTGVWHSQQVYLEFFRHVRQRSSNP
jgi:hypothetical protein